MQTPLHSLGCRELRFQYSFSWELRKVPVISDLFQRFSKFVLLLLQI